MNNFKKFIEKQRINRQIAALENEIRATDPMTSPWNTAIGWNHQYQTTINSQMSEKEFLYRKSIDKLMEQREALNAR